MDAKQLRVAVGECERFLERATALELLAETDDWAYNHSHAAAAVRRASMDLTKALAKLRSPS